MNAMIGADLPEFADFIGRVLEQSGNAACFRRTKLLCHPALWREEKTDASAVVNRTGNWESGVLTWELPENLGDYYCEPHEICKFRAGSESMAEFCKALHQRKLAASGKKNWIDCHGANLLIMSKFLEQDTSNHAVAMVGDGRASMYHLFQRGWTPKVAAKSWAANTAIALSLKAKFPERFLLLTPESLIADPVLVLNRLAEFLGSDHPLELANSVEVDLLSLASEYRSWPGRVTDTHIQYLLGMTPKPALNDYLASSDFEFTGESLMKELGFLNIPDRDADNPPQLSKFEQRLIDDFGKFLNPLVDFTKAKRKPEPSPESASPTKTGWRSWFKSAPGEAPSLSEIEPKPKEAALSMEVEPVEAQPAPLEGLVDIPAETQGGTCDLAVLIAFWGRHQILEQVVRGLMDARDDSTPNLNVVLVCSSKPDHEFASKLHRRFPAVGVTVAPNQPLGLKWQSGAEACRELGAKNVLITGSDDMVSPSFVRYGLPLMEEFDFIGVASWFLYDIGENSDLQGTLWELAYQACLQRIPLGAGRIYSSRILDKFDWELFDRERRSGLDSQGYLQVVKHGGKTFTMPSNFGAILSVKGDWVALNSSEKILAANTIQTDARDFREEEFFRTHFGISKVEFLERFGIHTS